MKFQAPKGTRDFYPQDMAVRTWIERRWQEVSERSGFVEYDGPVFEDLDLYRVKSGDEIVSQLFHFTDRGGREFALRPEMTPTLARMVAAKAHALAKPIKWYSMPRLCRAERPQRGRLREFIQWNVDILGEDDEIADAECIFVAVDFFRSVGLTPDQVEMRINSREVVSALMQSMNIDESAWPAVFAALDKREKVDSDKFSELVGGLGFDSDKTGRLIRLGEAQGEDGLAFVAETLAGRADGQKYLDSLRRVFDLLAAMGVGAYCRFDMSVVRGLAYYTGMVFEGFGRGGLRRAVCGGGRYARLLSDLGGPPIGGVGFATSDVVVRDLIEEFATMPKSDRTTDYFVIDADPQQFKHVLTLVGRLRSMGLSAEFSYKRQSVAKQFKQAASCSADRVVILEQDFAETKRVSVKDANTRVQLEMDVETWLKEPMQAIKKGED